MTRGNCFVTCDDLNHTCQRTPLEPVPEIQQRDKDMVRRQWNFNLIVLLNSGIVGGSLQYIDRCCTES